MVVGSVWWMGQCFVSLCGKSRPFVVVGGEIVEGGQEMKYVVQYVEEVEGVGLPKEGNTAFLNVL